MQQSIVRWGCLRVRVKRLLPPWNKSKTLPTPKEMSSEKSENSQALAFAYLNIQVSGCWHGPCPWWPGIPPILPTTPLTSLTLPLPLHPPQQGQRGEVVLFNGKSYSGIINGINMEKGSIVLEYATMEVSGVVVGLPGVATQGCTPRIHAPRPSTLVPPKGWSPPPRPYHAPL